MKTNFIYIISLIFFCQLLLAQKEIVKSEKHFDAASLSNTRDVIQYLSSDLIHNNYNASLSHQQNINNVNIQQIGTNNIINTQLQAKKTNLLVLQKGDNNQVQIEKQANTIYQTVLQQGDNNKIIDFAAGKNYNVVMELIQRGDNQSIENFGVNSISRDMKVVQSGNGAAIIIINR
jgi:minor curlin subunit